MNKLIIALIVLTVWDILTTLYILRKGGKELNPVLSRLFAQFGPEPVLIAIKVAMVAFLWWASKTGWIQDSMLGGICLLYALVGISNGYQAYKSSRQ